MKMATEMDNVLMQKEKDLEVMLDQGNKYSARMEEVCNNLRKETSEYKNLLTLTDRFLRYKAQLREDMEKLSDTYDDDIDRNEELEYMRIELEEFRGVDEVEDFFIEGNFNHSQNIAHRKNILANMEILIWQKLNMDRALVNSYVWIYSNLVNILKDYCENVRVFLERNKDFVDSQSNFGEKYKQLQLLMEKLSKEEVFLAQIDMQQYRDEKKEEKEDNQ